MKRCIIGTIVFGGLLATGRFTPTGFSRHRRRSLSIRGTEGGQRPMADAFTRQPLSGVVIPYLQSPERRGSRLSVSERGKRVLQRFVVTHRSTLAPRRLDRLEHATHAPVHRRQLRRRALVR